MKTVDCPKCGGTNDFADDGTQVANCACSPFAVQEEELISREHVVFAFRAGTSNGANATPLAKGEATDSAEPEDEDPELVAKLVKIAAHYDQLRDGVETDTSTSAARKARDLAALDLREEVRCAIEIWAHEHPEVDDYGTSEMLMTAGTDCMEMALRQVQKKTIMKQRTRAWSMAVQQISGVLVAAGLIDYPRQPGAPRLLGPDGGPLT